MLVEALGVQLLTIPYKGTAPAMNDLLGKQVDLLCDQTTNTTQQINAGSVKAYAVTSLQRVPTLSKLPTMDESGFKGFEVGIWHGMWVPKGTPKPVVDKLIKSLQAGLADPKFQDRMKQLGATVLTSDATRRRWTPRSSSRCRSGPSCSRRRASSSSKPRHPRKKAPFAGKGLLQAADSRRGRRS